MARGGGATAALGFQRIATAALEDRMARDAASLEPEHLRPAHPTDGVARKQRRKLAAMGWDAMRGTHLRVTKRVIRALAKRVIRAECSHHRPAADGP